MLSRPGEAVAVLAHDELRGKQCRQDKTLRADQSRPSNCGLVPSENERDTRPGTAPPLAPGLRGVWGN